jgi:hypothetical protein
MTLEVVTWLSMMTLLFIHRLPFIPKNNCNEPPTYITLASSLLNIKLVSLNFFNIFNCEILRKDFGLEEILSN